MARAICVRCGHHGQHDAPHLCKDVAARLDRATKLTDKVASVLAKHGVSDPESAIAHDIFRAVSGFTFD